MAEQQDIEGLEAALEKSGRQRIADISPTHQATASEFDNNNEGAPNQENKAVNQASGSHESEGKRPKGWDNLTVAEKDVVIVVAALCKVC